jgi:hypothetical protein
MLLADIRDFDITRLDTGVPELEGDPEEDGSVVSQRQAEKTRRLMQLWSAQDLTSLDTKERAVQEQEMMKVYTTFDEEGLVTALAIAASMALAKAGSGGERTPPKPTAEELIALQIRRRLSMRKAASLSESCAVKQLLDMKARVTRATKQTLAYLEWLPDDFPLPTVEEQDDGDTALIWQTPLDELHTRLTQLMGEVEHLHGLSTLAPAPWLLLCRNSDLLGAGQPTN